jgi:hypothetical protein
MAEEHDRFLAQGANSKNVNFKDLTLCHLRHSTLLTTPAYLFGVWLMRRGYRKLLARGNGIGNPYGLLPFYIQINRLVDKAAAHPWDR